ncbi:MAG TPA: malto-oligosyltrehalose trehalohydrolase [Flavitalea sp.]|nr:malto-oligosyltrehalose trehalohydrolase [Flavitalea sp.]
MRVNISKRNTGVNFNAGDAEIRVWSPLSSSVDIVLRNDRKIPMQKADMGYWYATTNEITPGSFYKISIDGKDPLPDPASLSQPEDVHSWSSAVDVNDFNWTDNSWKNVPQEQYIIYELHTGTFTPSHKFSGIIDKLDHLKELGITAIEVMPVAQFPGDRNWGYDGVFPFAVQHSYGGARGLQELVNKCHQKGIAVILDVIYNHIGPEGNYLANFGPYFTQKYQTPWGKALNFDDAWCDGVRDYFIENALMWFRDFHIDALRMDAVHAIKDFGSTHIIKEIRQHTDVLAKNIGRNFYLIAELDLNDPVFINPYEKCGYGADAQWVDEFHHALRVASGQPRDGYYSDFDGVGDLAKSFTDAYVYDGQFSQHRKKLFGKKTYNSGHQFIVFSQNHDQIGNRMLGERSSQLVSFEMCKLMAAAVFISPYLPMLFMGEEWAESNPFLFFISHTDKELAAIVNKGRKEEFSYFNWQGEPPDPRLENTFTSSMLQWELLEKAPHNTMMNYYKELIALRKRLPALRNTDRTSINAEANEEKKMIIVERWTDEQHITCVLNFSDTEHDLEFDKKSGAKKMFDSSAEEWGGNTPSPGKINPQSIIIVETK